MCELGFGARCHKSVDHRPCTKGVGRGRFTSCGLEAPEPLLPPAAPEPLLPPAAPESPLPRCSGTPIVPLLRNPYCPAAPDRMGGALVDSGLGIADGHLIQAVPQRSSTLSHTSAQADAEVAATLQGVLDHCKASAAQKQADDGAGGGSGGSLPPGLKVRGVCQGGLMRALWGRLERGGEAS